MLLARNLLFDSGSLAERSASVWPTETSRLLCFLPDSKRQPAGDPHR